MPIPIAAIVENDALIGIHGDDGIFGDFNNAVEQCL